MCGTTRPTNDTGPASDDRGAGGERRADEREPLGALTSTPRAAADSPPTLMRSSDARQRRACMPNATASSGSDRDQGGIAADVEHPISQRTVLNVSVKSARYCTKAITAESNDVHRHAAEQQHDRRQSAPPRGRQAVDDRKRAERSRRSSPAAPTTSAEQREIEAERDRQHRAERAPARDAERVRRRQRISQQRLKHDARESRALLPTSAAASTRGSRAMKKICASMLSAYGIDRSKTRRQ